MSLHDIEARVRKVLRDCIPGSSEEITSESSLKADLGLDSLDGVEFMMGLEDAFDIEIYEAEAGSAVTFGQVIELVRSKLESAGGAS